MDLRSWKTPQGQLFAALGALLAWCGSLIVSRLAWSGTWAYAFLLWNLFLACVPLAASTLLLAADERCRGRGYRLGCLAVWLLFLPNAPYLLTDLLHLGAKPPVPVWFDLILLLSCAGTGLLLGYISLAQVQLYVRRRRPAAQGWLVAMGSLLLSGYGIYLGRYQRWNSWDVLADPAGLFGAIASQLLHPGAHAKAFGVTLLYGTGLALAYAALWVIAAASVAVLRAESGGLTIPSIPTASAGRRGASRGGR